MKYCYSPSTANTTREGKPRSLATKIRTPLFLVFLVCALLPARAFGTAQIPEELVLEGKKEAMTATPLESYFDQTHPKPTQFASTSTACWRGYIGTWMIRDDVLFLISLRRERLEKVGEDWKEVIDPVPLTIVFPDTTGPVKAEWFSGVVSIPRGEMLRYVHMGFGSVYSQVLYITVSKGRITARRLIDNKEFGATRSDSDMQWVALAGQQVDDKGDWLDARLISSQMPHGEFKTRGIYFGGSEGQPSQLWIPDTPTTESVAFTMVLPLEKTEIAQGSHVEVNVTKLSQDGRETRLIVKSFRALKPGETIHHKDFRKVEPTRENKSSSPPVPR